MLLQIGTRWYKINTNKYFHLQNSRKKVLPGIEPCHDTCCILINMNVARGY